MYGAFNFLEDPKSHTLFVAFPNRKLSPVLSHKLVFAPQTLLFTSHLVNGMVLDDLRAVDLQPKFMETVIAFCGGDFLDVVTMPAVE